MNGGPIGGKIDYFATIRVSGNLSAQELAQVIDAIKAINVQGATIKIETQARLNRDDAITQFTATYRIQN